MKSIKQIRVITFILAIIVACNIYIPVKTEAAGTIYWPVPGHTSLTQGYGWNGSSGHKGIDISDGSIAGASVVASVGGYVDAIYLCPTQHNGSYGDCLGFGTGLIIRGDDGRYYQYAHMQANSIPGDVYYGAYVPAGKVIGAVGTTGYSSGYHLHYQISWAMWSNPINPMGESYIYSTIQKPSAPNVRISKDVLKTGEKATLSWDACNGATYYWVSCWSTTEQCISEAATGFSKEVSFSKPGRYSITVVSGNSEGETIGNWVDIEVFSKDGYLFIEYDNNDGTPDARLARVEYDTYYKIQKCFSQRACHKFIGWTAQRESDKKWHVDGHSWRTEAEIRDNNWDKTIYPANVAYKFDQSWYKGGKDGDTITFYAVWEEDHELKSTVIQEGSCTEAKIIDYACDCGQTGYRYTGTAKGHWSSGLITDDNGRIYRRCTVCGEILGYEFDFSVGIDLEKVFLLTQISNTSGGLELSWFAGGKEDTYNVYRKEEGTDWKYLGNTKEHKYTDKTVKSGVKYYYQIRKYCDGKETESTKEKAKIYLASPKLKKVANVKKGISLKWSKVSGAKGYVIYRKVGNKKFKAIKTIKNGSKLSFTDKTVKNGKKYTYKVKAYRGDEYSVYSKEKKIRRKK